jgi:hypothetical protein
MGAAGRARSALTKPAVTKIGVKPTGYSVANAVTGEIVATGGASAVTASTRRSVDTVAVADFDLRKVA